MQTNDNQNESKRKPSPFTIMNNVRDNCKQPVSKKLLMLTLATYCDGDGICYPSNRALVPATRMSERTIRRMLKQLAADGELKIITPGAGRDQKRIISLKRYVTKPGQSYDLFKPDTAMTANPDTAMTSLNRPRSLGKTSRNIHKEQPLTAIPSAHAEFVRLWCERYETVLGEAYAFQGGKDGKHVKKLLASSGQTPAQLIEVAEGAWKRPSGFWCKQAASISGFNSRFNEIRQEIKNGSSERKTTTTSRDAGAATAARASQYAGVGKVR